MEGAHAAVWLLDAAALSDEALALWLAALGPSELARYRRFVRPQRRRQFLAGRAMLRQIIAALSGVPPSGVLVTERQSHAPVLNILGHVAPLPYFSLSHSGPWIACAASLVMPLGLDIEAIDAGRDVAALATQAFSAEARAALMTLSHHERLPAFYAEWSRMEAEYKLGQTAGASYALPHPYLSVALCTARPLPAPPELCALELIHPDSTHTACASTIAAARRLSFPA